MPFNGQLIDKSVGAFIEEGCRERAEPFPPDQVARFARRKRGGPLFPVLHVLIYVYRGITSLISLSNL